MDQKSNPKPKRRMNKLAVRTLSGAVYLLVIIAGLFAGQWAFAGVAVLLTVLMMTEFYGISLSGRSRVAQVLAIVTALGAFALVFAFRAFGLAAGYIPLALIPLLFLLVWMVAFPAGNRMDDMAFILAGLLYIGLPMALSSLMYFRTGSFQDQRFMLGVFILIWASDVGAYCTGSLFGQKEGSRKLCPEISPNKSGAGFWGGMILTIAAAFLISRSFLYINPGIHTAGFAIVIHCAGVVGDLVESRWKRHFGVKDSGKIIPGHGGIMDRLDSTLTAMPAAALYCIATGLW